MDDVTATQFAWNTTVISVLFKIDTGAEANVVEENLPAVLGMESCEDLGIVQRVQQVSISSSLLDEYRDVFDGIGKISGDHQIAVNKDVRPVVHAQRGVPLSMMLQVKDELGSMEQPGVIRKYANPRTSMMCIEKRDKSVRICMDPKDLNKSVKREHHRIPTVEDIAVKLLATVK